MMVYTDQIGHQLNLKSVPKRIISLVPSQTELLYDLGLDEEVLGITKFCIHPRDWFHTKKRVGGTKTANFEKIAALNPDLIIANKEENTEAEIKALQKEYPVYTSNISNLKESLEMIQQVGVITGKETKAQKLIDKIKLEFEALKPYAHNKNNVLYLIWKSPYMSINQHTFINDMLNLAGFQNVIDVDNTYPEVSENQIENLTPDFIFLSSEPYPFAEKHLKELQEQYPKSKVVLVDGEYFSWYGSRLQNAPTYFKGLINEII